MIRLRGCGDPWAWSRQSRPGPRPTQPNDPRRFHHAPHRPSPSSPSSSASASFGDLFTKSKDIDIYAKTGDITTKANGTFTLAETHVGSVMAGSQLEGDVHRGQANGFMSTAVTNVGDRRRISGRGR